MLLNGYFHEMSSKFWNFWGGTPFSEHFALKVDALCIKRAGLKLFWTWQYCRKDKWFYVSHDGLPHKIMGGVLLRWPTSALTILVLTQSLWKIDISADIHTSLSPNFFTLITFIGLLLIPYEVNNRGILKIKRRGGDTYFTKITDFFHSFSSDPLLCRQNVPRCWVLG